MTENRLVRIDAPLVPGISDSVKVAPGELLFVSGAVGFENDGSVPTDFSRAVELTLRDVERALHAGGATVSDLDDEKLAVFRTVRDTILDLESVPASTVIGVHSLFKDSTIEIDAIAAV